jgi:DNA helicase-2/ATP-dependent DNA helicase PcrA
MDRFVMATNRAQSKETAATNGRPRRRMDRLPDLNAAQSEAVAHVNGPCVLFAGPGAGKTAVLTRRAALLVGTGVPPERILLLTFTRASAKEMMRRAAMIEPLCQRLSGGTFHAIGTKIINQNAHIFDMDRPFTVLDRDESLEIVKRLVEPLRAGSENWPRPSLVRAVISYAANTRSTIEEAVTKLSRQHVSYAEAILEVRDAYVAYKLDRGMLDYDDALEYFAALLEDAEIGPVLRSTWDYVMIDEYQDTNALQLDIVYGLTGDGGNVMVVGDPSQSIFGFRGSAPSTMTGYRDRFEGCKVIQLDTNYRSTAPIVNLANVVDRRLQTGFERTLRSASSDEGALPRFVETNDEMAQAKAIVDAILEHKAAGGEVSENAVIVRAMSWARVIEAEMTARRVPYRVVGGLKIDEAAHVKDLLSLARLSTNLRHEPAWLRILKRHKGVGDVAAGRLTDELTRAQDMPEAVSIIVRAAQGSGYDFAGLPLALAELSVPDRDPTISLEAAVVAMDPFWRTYKEWRDDWPERRRDFDAILLVAAEHLTMEGFLTAITLDASLDKKTSDEERQDEKPVTITTIHGAKGLEWDCVHIPSFVRGHMPAGFADDLDEEMRLLYVALTRARRDLRVYRQQFDRSGGFAAVSEFERIIRPHMETARIVKRAVDGGPIATGRRIDMSSRLLGRK